MAIQILKPAEDQGDLTAILANEPALPVSALIEDYTSHYTPCSTVYIYDLAEHAGFGDVTLKSSNDGPSVVKLQTRAGAGMSIVGRLSEGTSQETAAGAVLAAYTTPTGLAVMAQSLSHLPPAAPASRLIIQVPNITLVGETLALSPTLAPLALAWSILPASIVVLLSATPKESLDLAKLSYALPHSHVIHLFDHYSGSREQAYGLNNIKVPSQDRTRTVAEIINQSGYAYFDYAGDAEAETVVVLLNGPLALAAKALAASTKGLGVVVVRMLRPWDEAALHEVVPATAKVVHVFDDVPNEAVQGYLYTEVFGTLLQSAKAPAVHAHRIVPSQTQSYFSKPSSFRDVLLSLAPQAKTAVATFDSPQLKKLLFFGTPTSPLSQLPVYIEKIFRFKQVLSARLVTQYDLFSKTGGIVADRIILSPIDEPSDVPLPLVLPISSDSEGESDFLCVFDHALLKTHSILVNAKPGSSVLIFTPCPSTELLANLPPQVTSLVLERGLHIYTIAPEPKDSIHGPNFQTMLGYLAFLRLYLGTAATEALVGATAKALFGNFVNGIQMTKINARVWAGLQKVGVVADTPASANEPPKSAPPPLKHFQFNAIVPAAYSEEATANARLGSWHDAAKHLIFPSVLDPTFGLTSETETEQYPQNPALRPEVPERTFLVTTTVNRRLTPLEYDRNVFHLEFDTSGTGLKYAIGEALGVHGWNDEQDVLDFCAWYGADPNQLITIPVVAGEPRLHTRTVFQALQQQIDLFGRPTKSFYTDLAQHAKTSIDKHALLFIGSPEGSATFKKLAEKDTVTFAEILQKYASARPSIEILCQIVGDIKPRHYSIASAQSVVGDRVDLLVVTVDWVNPSG